MRKNVKPPKWFTLTLAAVISWGLWGIASKLAADRIPPFPNQVLASLGLFIPAVFAIPALRRERGQWPGLALAFGAGLLGASGNLALLAALTTGAKAAVVFPLTALYPLITVAAAVAFMRERLQTAQIFGIGVAIVAVVLLSIEPGTSWASFRAELRVTNWLTLTFAALLAYGASAILQKLATNRLSGEAALGGFAMAFLPVALAIWIWSPWPAALPTAPIVWGVFGGVLNGLGVLATLAAYRAGGKASLVTPLGALYPVLTVILALTFLRERLDARQLSGIALAIVAGVCLGRERQ